MFAGEFMSWIAVNRRLSSGRRRSMTVISFALPILIWCAVSYVPALWHPQVEITSSGSVSFFREGMRVDGDVYEREWNKANEAGLELPQGTPANPVYLPAHIESLAMRVCHSQGVEMITASTSFKSNRFR